MPEPAIEIRDVQAGYGGTRVVHGVTLLVAPGERVALLGPNGAGKTTLLKVVCGALAPTGGEARLLGRAIATLGRRERARTVAFVPQMEAPAFDLTVRELVLTARLPWTSRVFESRADHAAVEQALADAECVILAERSVHSLSGGEFQRVLIARALAQETPIVLMDEPTNHLDPRHQLEMGELVARMTALGRTVVATSHDISWALLHFPRIALMAEGKVAYDGPSSRLPESGVLQGVYGVEFRNSGLVPTAREA